ncbi:MAG: FAD-binding oxidoreductase [Deltaproteobacteria bacterium]|jgi:FAD/FMN-containing dehydrogenase/Fe-S oxidoreductase|nr:FAD-binding oxidoreductase [Deltaproteobacteria bacterium]
MPLKGPHISIKSESLVERILRVKLEEFEEWPEAVRRLTVEIAEELFMVRYNPFIDPAVVRASVRERFERSRRGLAMHYANSVSEGITMFWSAHDADLAFRDEIISKLRALLPEGSLDTRASSRVENATDATDLRLELPLLVVTPATTEEGSRGVRLANEMQCALVPRGGGSGYTGGAIPARKRSVVLALTKLNRIMGVDAEARAITAQAGVTTNEAALAAAAAGLLFSVDPASKTASCIGGNIAENSGGPLAVAYGTTVDNLLSYRMVLPTGECIEVIRRDHPRRKIEERDQAVFEVRDLSGGLRNVVKISGRDLRRPGLGKDVTNKTLGGLPGVQKEGVDGIIVDATFVLHPLLKHSRVMVWEFFGDSMHNAALAINDLIALRDRLTEAGGRVKLSMLEEFGGKYVRAVEYKRKSSRHEGDPISVLVLQMDSDDEGALDDAVREAGTVSARYAGVDAFVAKDAREAELFWEDRHRLSAIARRTSGFKINEDVVIPLAALPEFALFLEELNVEGMARAYRRALQEIGRLRGLAEDDKEFNREFTYASRLLKGERPADGKAEGAKRLTDQDLQLQAVLYLGKLRGMYPGLADKIGKIEDRMLKTQVVVASHMHAGDGNCHVNLPVNSGDVDMVAEAGAVADRVMQKAKALGGSISGEHGVGITKIAFLEDERIAELKEFKALVDPRNIINPAKLTQKELPVSPFTFSFNRLIEDLNQSGLPDKERLIDLLTQVQICTRCGKCKEVCAVHYPEKNLLYYPRNRNMSLGALIEAIYYSQVDAGRIEPALLRELRGMTEYCTGCGKCGAVCPVKINSQEVTMTLRAFLEDKGEGGHPFKSRAMGYIAVNPASRFPRAAKAASVGQRVANRALPLIPASLRGRFYNPLFSGPGPAIGYRNLFEGLKLERGSIFAPPGDAGGTLLYFPGCAGSMFYRGIGLAGTALLLRTGWGVAMPPEAMCCGYPALSAGLAHVFASNQARNIEALRSLAEKAARLGRPISMVLTACGSCRDGLERYNLPQVIRQVNEAAGCKESAVGQEDVFQFLLRHLPGTAAEEEGGASGAEGGDGPARGRLIYHAPCHAEWSGVHKKKAPHMYAGALGRFTGLETVLSPDCCAESGVGAITSPLVYNSLRGRKAESLQRAFSRCVEDAPVLVGCPSCKMGVSRALLGMGLKRPVLHTLEYLAQRLFGRDWRPRAFKIIGGAAAEGGVRLADMSRLPGLKLSETDQEEDA